MGGISIRFPIFSRKAWHPVGGVTYPRVAVSIGIRTHISHAFGSSSNTLAGIYMRSVADNQTAALSLGVHVRWFLPFWAIAPSWRG
jgi:branched-subunit amino acid ABC-type transport system permease component